MRKISNNELKSNQRVILIAQEFTKLGKYPEKNSPNGICLQNKRQAFKHYTNGTRIKKNHLWYPSDIEVAKTHGLPDDWMLLIDREKESNQKVILIAQEFKKLGTYPNQYSSNGKCLNRKRQAFKHYANGTKCIDRYKWYPSDIKVAKDHGLPDDWMLITKTHDPFSREKESNQKVILIAQEFKKLGTYPNQYSLNGICLNYKRQAFKHYTNGTKCTSIWYPSDIKVAKDHGLPDDWMLTTKTHDPVSLEKESNQKVILIAQEFKKLGTYPNLYSLGGKCLNRKRIAFKYYINGIKSYYKWYPSDIEVAKAHGLPDDWMLRQKLGSSGERRTKLILEKLNITPKPQYRHKLCVNKRCLPFDFYFNKDNLHYFIEYNGEQHYKPIYGKNQIAKEENFKKTQKNDLIKLNFCKKYNYPLLVIPYWLKDDFENLISEFIKTTQFDPTFAQPNKIS